LPFWISNKISHLDRETAEYSAVSPYCLIRDYLRREQRRRLLVFVPEEECFLLRGFDAILLAWALMPSPPVMTPP
jgi:hypothetical protein